jgi:hypothetical protein
MLAVRLEPSNAQLRIDGQPRRVASARWLGELVGRHHIAVTARGHRGVAIDVTVEPGQIVEVPIVLPRLPAPRARARAVAKLPADDFHTIDPWKR